MNRHLSPLLAPLVVAGVLVPAIYLTAVLDRALHARVAGRRLHAGELFMAPAREAAFLLLQQRARTERSDAEAWALAPALLASLAAVALAAAPLGPSLAVADAQSGIVLFGAAVALVMVAVFLNGWAPNSFFPLVGAYRFVAMALSYEMPFALVLIAAALPAQSLAVGALVEAQAGLWNVARQPLGLPIYLVTALGIGFWGPLNLSDAADLAGGTRAELSGAALLLWRAARGAVLVAVAAMGAAVFLGGWRGPWLPGPAWMALKTVGLLVVLLAAGHLLPRVRQERFVWFAWVVLIPLALVDIFLSGLLLLL